MAIPKGKLSGHGFERANICAECGGPLAHPKDGHYHSRRIWGDVGAEPICCKHSPQKCFVDPLAHFKGYGVTYIPDEKGELADEVEDTETDDNQDFTEEQSNMSKTSQNKAVQEAMKGQKAAKAAKEPKAAGRPKKEKAEYVYTPMPANFKGNVVKVSVSGKEVSPIHKVADGKTVCGYSITEQSKGDKHYDLQFIASKGDATCKRCTAEPKPAKAAKEPTPIKAAKGKKADK